MFYDLVKRLIDIAGAAILSVLFLPIWVIIPILLKIDSKGPIFYKPDRVGKNGQVFGMYKFRSMKMFEINGKVVHAVEFWKHNPELYEKYKKAGWKLELDEDPRITKLGKILRQTSIDETPQVINVLKGEMSLVGPRAYVEPELEDAKKRYGSKITKLIKESLSAKPGITGPWQVSGRNEIPWNQRVAIDADYAKRRSILYDIYIILKTPFAMISKW
ncbi:MAG: Sugar transferase, probable phospho-glucosyltransferase [Candidatus Collierbacteria bacterium GW2011_GWB1_44_6]|uniref:Sugar transferase, probable phospho-glucosyltransferase n=1 Tax=Candidatus Collierbacteria bacterium GW2011_GWB1_44_6 TaxID=1618384 RepID=A0A0G1JKS4_9BACT|nr:MAG: Sugar transferase, probable phospho-glucosyltransferase [Candidatus Moranbacteria bacterium GW2011_GWC2_40_12]KKT71980.1 MAG: Sugar transferase, probable phospho-glucosyltransferase [Candidatus Collierbacteria bacterium GW2011_GWB1_44_6]KKT81393.1 MAG: Sugar transferase, probable phospho-glucosyltransferase [Microgenomates group bacterium GW2011_GWC1_44_9]